MWQYAYIPWRVLRSAAQRVRIHERAEQEGVAVMHFRDGTLEVRGEDPEKVRRFLGILEREYHAAPTRESR